MSRRRLLIPLFLLTILAGCDQLGLESATQVAEKRAAEGRAVGGACRHAGRAIEDCYTLNRRTDKAAIYAGWREMDDYMRENKIAPVAPVLTPGDGRPRVAEGGDPTEETAVADKADKADKADRSARPAHADKGATRGDKAAPKAGAGAHADEKSTEAAAPKSDVAAAH